MQAELPNIRQALQWAVRSGNVDTGLYTAAGLWRFWQVRGHTHEARRHLEAMLAEASGSAEARAAGNLAVAQCAFVQGDHAAVQEHVAAAMDVHRRSGDTHSVAFGLMLLGASAGRAGDADHGEPLLREAMDRATAARRRLAGGHGPGLPGDDGQQPRPLRRGATPARGRAARRPPMRRQPARRLVPHQPRPGRPRRRRPRPRPTQVLGGPDLGASPRRRLVRSLGTTRPRQGGNTGRMPSPTPSTS